MKKYLLLAIIASFSGKAIATDEHDTLPKKIQSCEFPYRKEIFELYMTSDIDLDSPSLVQLYKDAQARKKHLDALVDHVRNNKFNKQKNKDIFNLTNYSREKEKNNDSYMLPEDLHMMASFQADYLPERDLTEYFLQALGRFAQTPATHEQIQELYKQTVYASRMNLESLKNAIFLHLSSEYPDRYQRVRTHGGIRQQELLIPCNFRNREDKFYADFRHKHPESISDISDRDTVSVTKMARTLTHPPVPLTNPGIIYELNSLLFYLNMERALLNACPDLVFNPHDYNFDKDLSAQNEIFALSRISDFHRQGVLHQLMASPTPEQRKLKFCLQTKDRLLETLLNNKADKPIDFFLQKLFPRPAQIDIVSSTSKTKTPKKSPHTKPKKGAHKKKSHKNTQSKRSEVDSQKNSVAAQTPTNFMDLLLEEDIHEEDQPPATLEELQEIETLIANTSTQQPTYASAAASTSIQPTQPLIIKAYQSSLHVDDYTYKRCTSTAPNGSYLFSGQVFEMPGMHFDVNTLREIKKITHHDPERASLQNLASYQLRFHFQHEDGSHDLVDFVSPYQYLSGGRRLGSQYRQEHHIKMAFHDYFTPAQAKISLTKRQEENREFLLNILSAQVNEHVVQGPWHHNCVDSEALMLIDIQKEMPTILQKMAPAMGEKITLLGAVLGASSYHDPCWRCRNLFQGWQWGLRDTITHWKDAYHLPITLSPDFSTIVFGFGEVAPQSVDFFPPRASVQTTLGTSNVDAKRHKLTIVSLKKETL